MRTVLFLLLLLPACGAEEPTRTAPADAAKTLDRMRDALSRRDWGAIYDLYAPSERSAAEARWDAMRSEANQAGSPHKSRLDGFALEVGKPAAEVAAMDLRSFFVLRNQAQQQGRPPVSFEVRDFEKLDGEFGMARVKFGSGVQQLPMKLENGVWYLAKTLEALTDF